jgi:hypothetical protein
MQPGSGTGGQVGSRRRRTTAQGLVGEHDNLHGTVSRRRVQLVPSTKVGCRLRSRAHRRLTNARSRTKGWPPFSRGRRPQLAVGLPPNNPVMAHETAHPSVQRLRPLCIVKRSTNCAECFQAAPEIRFLVTNDGRYNEAQDKGPEFTAP